MALELLASESQQSLFELVQHAAALAADPWLDGPVVGDARFDLLNRDTGSLADDMREAA